MLATAVLLGALAGAAWIQLGALVAVAAGAWVALRRRRPAGPRAQTVALTAQHALHVVEIGGSRLLVGTGPAAAPRLLRELSDCGAQHSRAIPVARPGEALSAYRHLGPP